MKLTRMPTVASFAPAALLMLLAFSATASTPATGSPPWQISNGHADAGLYMPREVQQAYAKGSRSPDGKPGKNYWQNEATHRIRISLNPPSKRVQGEQEIVYNNNSPDALPILIFRLYANAHQAEAIREKSVATAFLADGITVDEFSIDGVTKPWNDPASPLASINVRGSTVHGIALDKPLPAKASVRIRMRWHYDLVDDAGWKEGAIDENTFFLAYFFPRVTNYSDYSGWDYSPFTLGREFNNDFADFHVEVDAPRDYVVWATGTLQNPGEVLQPAMARRLAASFKSDEVVTLAEAADIKAGKVTARVDRLTWKWQATHVPDFAIAVSNNYRWQASSVVVDPASKRRTSVQAAYADTATDFRTIVASARKSLQFASTAYPGIPYPYPKTTIVLGSADEEYPMMVNDGSVIVNPTRTQLPQYAFTDFVAAHEILHSWFPFHMGINEKRYPFMDEGWTTAFEYLRNRDVLGAPTADALFKEFRAGGWATPTSSFELPIITPHDAMWGQSAVFGFNQYGKAAMGFLALKDLMGEPAFRTGLHEFMVRWQGKRPLPWDMFNSFNDAGVGDYTWFFNNWFFSYNHSDLALAGAKNGANGWSVAVHNPGGMAVPFDLVLNYADGSSERIHRTPIAWRADPRKTEVSVTAGKSLKSISLDTGIYPDANPADNTWTATATHQTSTPPEIETARREPASVRVDGDTLYYTGNFSTSSTKAFDAAVAGIGKGQLTRLVIFSGGGDTVAGRHVGRWVRDMGLVVEVDVICFSSCADYVFPAGRARVIRADAFVGWHGNERQFAVLAERQGVPLTDILRRFAPADAPKAAVDAFVTEFSDTLDKTQKDEAEFYASLGLSDAFAVCAVGDDVEKRFGFTGKKGWGFSIDDMVRLGLNNTVYLGDGAYEKTSTRFKEYLVPITADECQALLK